MKKTLLFVLLCVVNFSIYAQTTNNDNIYNGIESHKSLNLSAEQVAKIKKLNQEISPKYAQIGKDRSLSGYEKGQKKRELALKHKAELQKILTTDQINILEKEYGSLSSEQGIKDKINDSYDNKLKALEQRYKTEKNKIENDTKLSKQEKKDKIQSLKDVYKTDKQKLKKQKDAVKETPLLKQ